jgi:predicted phosphohydrolase
MRKLLINLIAAISTVSAASGLDFIMVGDFGWIMNMTNSQKNFDVINSYVGNVTAKGGKIDFLMTMGDNIYSETE